MADDAVSHPFTAAIWWVSGFFSYSRWYLGGAAVPPSVTEKHSIWRSRLQSTEVLDPEVSVYPLQMGYQPHRSPVPSQTKPTGLSLLHKRWNPLELLYPPPSLLQASHLERPSGDFSPDERSKACGLLPTTIRFRVMVRILAPPGEQTMEGSRPLQSVWKQQPLTDGRLVHSAGRVPSGLDGAHRTLL